MTQTEPKRSKGLGGLGRIGRLLNILFTLALFGLPSMALAQIDQARITGVVRDQNNAMIPGATVTVKNERTGETRTTSSKEDGAFIITNLKPSLYTIQVSAANFAKSEYTNVEVVVGQEFNLSAELKPAGSTESITIVGGEEAALDTSSARMGANVNDAEVKGLPLNGRQLSQLYLQAPGALNSGSGTFGDIRFSGRAVEQNVVRYDGVEGSAIIDASPGNLNGEIASPFRLQASLENVQEFRVDSNSYPAEYGTGTGGQVTVVTKSGGNKYHGSAFEYLRNDKLDSRNFFDGNVKSPLRLNQFGASLGGPVLKDKFFFFTSYEGYRVRSGVVIQEAVPKLSRCAVAVNATIQNLCANGFLSPNGTRFVTDPAVSPDFDLARLVGSNSVDENSGALRLDYRANDKNSFYVRYFRDQGFNDQPQNVSGARATYDYVPQNAVGAWQTTIGANKINELKLGYNGVYTRVNGSTPPVNGIDLGASTINITGNVANAGIAGQGNPSGVSIPGGLFRLNSATNGRGAPYTAYTLAPMDNFSWLLGAHSLKFGGEARFVRLYTDRLGGTTYTYGTLTDFLSNSATSIQFNGDVSSSPFNAGQTGTRFVKQEYYIAYAQDEWKIKPNLTFNYGLRYEYYTPLREDQDRQVLFDINTGQILDRTLDAFNTRKNNFAPRLSVAWSPYQSGTGFIGGGKTVIRAGFGINYGPGQLEDQIQPIESDRISSTISDRTNPILQAGFPANIQSIVDNFNNNPNNRQYQPRAYDRINYEVPERVYSYTASIQQELPYKMALTLAYVGSQGRNLFLRSVTNQITQVLPNVENPAGAATIIREFSIVTDRGPGLNPRVQNPFAEIDYKTAGGHDSYNAFQASLARRFNTGVTLNTQYTYSTSRGNSAGSNEAVTSGNNARDIADFDYDDGYNNFDVRQTFNLSAIYSLPFGRNLSGVSKTLLAGWELGTIVNVRSGLPIPVQITRPDILYLDTNTGLYFGGPGANRVPVVNKVGGGASRNVSRPNLVAGVDPFLDRDRQVLNPAAFSIPLPGTVGNLERNLLKGPAFFQQDLIVAKKFAITEGINMEFRSEFFNLFNHTNFGNPPAQLPSTFSNTGASTLQPGQAFTAGAAGAAFGLNNRTVERVVGLGTNRQIQFALRLNF
ncbi:MAG TPA: carboxypeptidase regulatory-like domain-containing protein [Blastocatellia bacterium]|jgi:hypothetical protein|nr:carboxypeptidase regulatory-like domain-containing protein [Blastocatellia bacterium]